MAGVTEFSGVYGILPADLELTDLLTRAEGAMQGGIRILQFRDKSHKQDAFHRARALRVVTEESGTRLIINDSIQLALDIGADGVHLGRGDIGDLSRLRSEAGDKLIIGITCRSDIDFGKQALKYGANYLSFGAVIPSSSKPEVPAIGLPGIKMIRNRLPNAKICAIGGITINNLAAVKSTGADMACLISGLFDNKDISEAASHLIRVWEAECPQQ